MKTLKMEVCMLPPGGYISKKIKVKRTFEGHFPGLVWHIFLGTVEASFHEWKIRTEWFWEMMNRDVNFYKWKIQNKWSVWMNRSREYFRKGVELERHVLESEIRIVILLVANIAIGVWLIHSNVFLAEVKYNLAVGDVAEVEKMPLVEQKADLNSMLKLDIEEVKEVDKKEKKEETEVPKNIKELNSVLPPQEEKCEEEKEEKISSDQCKENYDEYLEELEKEEKEKMEKLNTVRAQAKPRINARKPYVFDVVGGRKVCNKKNDKPSKSKNNKRGHMDMECCLDPDEIPNPHCYYPSSKYGKYLGKK